MSQCYDDSWLRKNLSDLPYAACLTDPTQPDNPLIFVNELFCDLTGYDPTQLIGKNCRLLQHPTTDANEVARIRRAVETGDEIAADLLNVRADGTTFWNRLSIKPIRDDDGALQRFTGVLMQIENSPYETLLEAQRQSDTALTELSHRLKNHLSLIHSSVRLQIRESGETEGLRAVLNRIQSLQTLYAGMEQGADAPGDFNKVDLFDHLATICETVTDLEDRVGFERDIPAVPVEVSIDTATQLGMMVAEIVTNAIQHAFADNGGTITLQGAIASDGVTITVADDGRGMSGGQTDVIKSGLGGKILRQMAKTLSADLTIVPRNPGTAVRLQLNLGEK